MTAFSADGTLGPDVQVASRLNRLEPVTSLLLNEGLVEYLNDLLNDPLMVTAADPANGSTMPVPLVPVITLTFDEPAKIGPGILGITVTSGSDVRNVFATVNGNQLQVIPSKALNSKELGGTTWHVHVPSDAAVSQALGNPLSSDYGFSFTVSGVN